MHDDILLVLRVCALVPSTAMTRRRAGLAAPFLTFVALASLGIQPISTSSVCTKTHPLVGQQLPLQRLTGWLRILDDCSFELQELRQEVQNHNSQRYQNRCQTRYAISPISASIGRRMRWKPRDYKAQPCKLFPRSVAHVLACMLSS